jgi:hypothetical protein
VTTARRIFEGVGAALLGTIVGILFRQHVLRACVIGLAVCVLGWIFCFIIERRIARRPRIRRGLQLAYDPDRYSRCIQKQVIPGGLSTAASAGGTDGPSYTEVFVRVCVESDIALHTAKVRITRDHTGSTNTFLQHTDDHSPDCTSSLTGLTIQPRVLTYFDVAFSELGLGTPGRVTYAEDHTHWMRNKWPLNNGEWITLQVEAFVNGGSVLSPLLRCLVTSSHTCLALGIDETSRAATN